MQHTAIERDNKCETGWQRSEKEKSNGGNANDGQEDYRQFFATSKEVKSKPYDWLESTEICTNPVQNQMAASHMWRRSTQI